MPSDLMVGMRVFWTDPDEGTCSGFGSVIAIEVDDGEPADDSTIIAVQMDNGGEADCYASELTPETECST
jgi:hypothetical protein